MRKSFKKSPKEKLVFSICSYYNLVVMLLVIFLLLHCCISKFASAL